MTQYTCKTCGKSQHTSVRDSTEPCIYCGAECEVTNEATSEVIK